MTIVSRIVCSEFTRLLENYKGALAKPGIGVERNCSSKSHGGEDDSTGLRTQTAYITPRTRCVPPEALNSAATAKTKVTKRGAARFPVLVFARWNANLPIGDADTPFRRMASREAKCGLGGFRLCLPWRPFKIFCFLFLCLFLVFFLDLRSSTREPAARTRRNEKGRRQDGEQGDGGQKRGTAKFSHKNPPSRMVTNRRYTQFRRHRSPGRFTEILTAIKNGRRVTVAPPMLIPPGGERVKNRFRRMLRRSV